MTSTDANNAKFRLAVALADAAGEWNLNPHELSNPTAPAWWAVSRTAGWEGQVAPEGIILMAMAVIAGRAAA